MGTTTRGATCRSWRFATFNDEREQHLCAAILRPGNPSEPLRVRVLRRLVPLLRTALPKARLRVRLDGGFAGPETFELLEAERLEYVVAMGKNAVLTRAAEPAHDRGPRAARGHPTDGPRAHRDVAPGADVGTPPGA